MVSVDSVFSRYVENCNENDKTLSNWLSQLECIACAIAKIVMGKMIAPVSVSMYGPISIYCLGSTNVGRVAFLTFCL